LSETNGIVTALFQTHVSIVARIIQTGKNRMSGGGKFAIWMADRYFVTCSNLNHTI